MNRITPSHYHTIPSELLESIVSYLSTYEALVSFKNSYYIIYKLAKDIQMWKRLLLKSRYALLYKDVSEYLKITVSIDDYPKLYYTFNHPFRSSSC